MPTQKVKPANAPDLELVEVPAVESFKVWSHGLPFRTVRWHFHPEYEIHLITETAGRSFVGDYIGGFAPGNLVMTGPNLPHNWISDVPPETVIERRCLVLQFSAAFIAGCMGNFPELRVLAPLLEQANAGLEFDAATGAAAQPVLEALLTAHGPARIGLFCQLLELVHRAPQCRRLSSTSYRPNPAAYVAEPLNLVLAHISHNLAGDLCESELAQLCGFSASAFSRAFQRHTGQSFVRYINRLRVNRACELLISSHASIADICFQVGFNNLSNFNRQFLAQKQIPPSRFRLWQRGNATSSADDAARPHTSALGRRHATSEPMRPA